MPRFQLEITSSVDWQRVKFTVRSQKLLKKKNNYFDGKFSVSSLRCVGACGLAPVVTVGEKVYGRVAPEDVKGIIAEY